MEFLNWLAENWLPLLFILPFLAIILRMCWEILTGKS